MEDPIDESVELPKVDVLAAAAVAPPADQHGELERGSEPGKAGDETAAKLHLASAASEPSAVVGVDARELVRSVYRAILAREPEPSALTSYAAVIATGSLPVSAFIEEVAASAEAMSRHLIAGMEAFSRYGAHLIAGDPLPNGSISLDANVVAGLTAALERPGMLDAMMQFALKRRSLASILLIDHELRS